MYKQNVVYPSREILSGNKKEVLIHAMTWMNLETIMLSARSQLQQITYFMIPSISNVSLDKSIDTDWWLPGAGGVGMGSDY